MTPVQHVAARAERRRASASYARQEAEFAPCASSTPEDQRRCNAQFSFVHPKHCHSLEQQQSLVPRSLIVQGSNWYDQDADCPLLSGLSIAQLSLDIRRDSDPACNLPALYTADHHLPSVFQSSSPPDSLFSISSPSSIASFDSWHTLPVDFQTLNQLQEIRRASTTEAPFSPNGNSQAIDMGPGTPQPGEDEYLQHHLLQANAASPYPLIDDGSHPGSGYATTYGSPASNHWAPEHYDDRQEMYAPRYEWHGGPDPRYAQHYPAHYQQQPGPMLPPASRQAAQQKTRAQPTRAKKSKPKADDSSVPKLVAPLSVLTGDMDVPVKDMDRVCNKSSEERLEDVKKKNGYVSRPMNAFMLYRAAYAERAKKWCSQNNHQIVSKVAGASWPMETNEVRMKYKNLADLESANHKIAHPSYKFSPMKAQEGNKKRKGQAVEEETEYDGSDLEWTPSGARNVRPRARRQAQGYHAPGPAPVDIGYGAYPSMPMHPVTRSGYHTATPGRPLPMNLAELGSYQDPNAHYYAQTMPMSMSGQYHHEGGGLDDVRLQRRADPVTQPSAPSGLPGANHDDLVGDFDRHAAAAYASNDALMDPNLFADPSAYDQGTFNEQSFNDFDNDAMASMQKVEHRPHVAPQVADRPEPNWESEQDFQAWLDQETSNTK